MKKQPDKITAYYYRAANKQTDLNLDNQMHRLLSHAQENGTDTYMFFVDNGYSGLIAERPALVIPYSSSILESPYKLYFVDTLHRAFPHKLMCASYARFSEMILRYYS